jgi:hypothetical protein
VTDFEKSVKWLILKNQEATPIMPNFRVKLLITIWTKDIVLEAESRDQLMKVLDSLPVADVLTKHADSFTVAIADNSIVRVMPNNAPDYTREEVLKQLAPPVKPVPEAPHG